jgi:hypothetical protein
MYSPQERVIKKMIDNIVESNKPVFEKSAASTVAPEAGAAPVSTPSAAPAAALSTEDYTLISRKLEYGFNQMRQENADLRKLVEEVNGAVKMLRNDMDQLRMQQRNSREQPSQHHEAPRQAAPAHHSQGAPQYRKSEADEAYEQHSGQSAHEDAPQARGIQQKKDDGANIDISKVFYYGKK